MKLKKYSVVFVTAFSLMVLFFLFFYKLNDAPLLSYDEAWYAEITRNLVKTKNPFYLTFNHHPFIDHPPFGFILMSLPTTIFGSNEFSTRFISALLGMLSVVLIYFVGKKLGDRATGVVAAIVLISSMWFMFRARSGNLDVPLVFFSILTIFLLLKKKKKFFYLGVASLALTLMIKTLVGMGILPVAAFLIYRFHFKYLKKTYFKAVGLFLIITLPWYAYNIYLDHNFLYRHFFEIGVRGAENSYGLSALKNSLNYLAIGVGKWYKIFLVALPFLFFNFIKTKKRRWQILTVALWFLGFAVFLVSSKTEIWHLLPLYPPLALSVGLLPIMIGDLFNLKAKTKFISAAFLIFGVLVGVYQYHQFANLIYTHNNGYSDEKDIATKAGKYKEIYLLETFLPATVYYSQKEVVPLHWHKNAYQDMLNLLKIDNSSQRVFIIDQKLKNQLKMDGVKFRILEENGSYLIISH